MTKHTKLPWIYGKSENSGGYYINIPDCNLRDNIYLPDIANVKTNANAAFIVKCVNAYPRLVEEIKELLACLDLIDATKGMNNAKTRYYLEPHALIQQLEKDDV